MQNLTQHDFFSKIDSEVKAYLLGFIFADGCITQRKTRKEFCLSISVAEKDSFIIDLFCAQIAPHKKPKKFTPKPLIQNGKVYQSNSQIFVRIYSKRIFADLRKLGCDERKTYTGIKFPNIKDEFKRHFIRGYFDGNGTCQADIVKRMDRPIGNSVKKTFHIITYTSSFLLEISNCLNKMLGISTKVYPSKSKYFQLKCIRVEDLKKVYYYFYDDAIYFFERKRIKFYQCSMLTPREFRELKDSEPRNA